MSVTSTSSLHGHTCRRLQVSTPVGWCEPIHLDWPIVLAAHHLPVWLAEAVAKDRLHLHLSLTLEEAETR